MKINEMKSNLPFCAVRVQINFTLRPPLLPLVNQFSIGHPGKHECKQSSIVPVQMLRLYEDKHSSCTKIYWIQQNPLKMNTAALRTDAING